MRIVPLPDDTRILIKRCFLYTGTSFKQGCWRISANQPIELHWSNCHSDSGIPRKMSKRQLLLFLLQSLLIIVSNLVYFHIYKSLGKFLYSIWSKCYENRGKCTTGHFAHASQLSWSISYLECTPLVIKSSNFGCFPLTPKSRFSVKWYMDHVVHWEVSEMNEISENTIMCALYIGSERTWFSVLHFRFSCFAPVQSTSQLIVIFLA